MARVKCPNKHLYDDKYYHYCPLCSVDVDLNAIKDSVAVQLEETAGPYDEDLSGGSDVPVIKQRRNTENQYDYVAHKNDSSCNTAPKTVGYFRVRETDPVVGWIVCMNKDMRGTDFRLVEGRNILSNKGDADICLPEMKDGSGGMAIMYDAVNVCFYIQSGSSDVLVNGEPVEEAAMLQGECVIDVDGYNLVFVPFCGPGKTWEE